MSSQLVPLKLSLTKPDFDSLVVQLQMYASAKDSWKDFLTSSTGQSLIEMNAAVGALNQTAISLAFREAFLRTARRSSSIYASADTGGVRLSRKVSAGTVCTLTRTGSTAFSHLIPTFTQFDINGQPFFNRDAITFAAGSSSTTATLYQGVVAQETFNADGSNFQEYTLQPDSFTVSDSDIRIESFDSSTNNYELWSVTTDGLWIANEGQRVYYDRTDGNGRAVFTFGNGIHGAIPLLGTQLIVTYVVTNGSTGNNGVAGLQVKMSSDTTITGITTTTITGGADEKPASYYKVMAPYITRSKNRAVDPTGYDAIISEYPGIASTACRFQRDIAPDDLRWMNAVRVCILPQASDQFTTAQWNDFESWFATRSHAAIGVQRFNPIKVNVTVSVLLAIFQNAKPSEVQVLVESRIRSLFEKRATSLGLRIAKSDIVEACDIDDVDYIQVLSPSSEEGFYLPDTDLNQPYTWWNLNSLNIDIRYSERRVYPERS